MTDPTTSAANVAVSSTGRRPSVYQESREVNTRARVTTPNDAPSTARALNRLDQALSSGEPLSRDVPRGYYLNIVV